MEHLKDGKGKGIMTKNIFHTPDKDHTKIHGTRSWFDQNDIEPKLARSSLTSCSKSEKNFATGKIVSTSEVVKKIVTQKINFT